MEIKNIMFWVLILSAVGVAVWLLIGSPTIEQGLLMITIFIASSEILIWKTIFKKDNKNNLNFERLDKKTTISFEKMKSHMNNKFLEINNQLNEIKLLIKK